MREARDNKKPLPPERAWQESLVTSGDDSRRTPPPALSRAPILESHRSTITCLRRAIRCSQANQLSAGGRAPGQRLFPELHMRTWPAVLPSHASDSDARFQRKASSLTPGREGSRSGPFFGGSISSPILLSIPAVLLFPQDAVSPTPRLACFAWRLRSSPFRIRGKGRGLDLAPVSRGPQRHQLRDRPRIGIRAFVAFRRQLVKSLR
jgi:hypothetical protein